MKVLHSIVVLLLLAIALFTLHDAGDPITINEPLVDMAEQKSDYYLESFIIKTLGADGKLKHKIAGQTLTHYPDDDTSLINPISVLINRNPAPDWTIDAAQGWLSSGAVQLDLRGPVALYRAAHQAQPAMQVDTFDLLLDTESHRVSTERKTTIVSGQWRTQGVGMDGNAKTGDLTLLDKVEFIYAPTH